jgi:hypothetical protein
VLSLSIFSLLPCLVTCSPPSLSLFITWPGCMPQSFARDLLRQCPSSKKSLSSPLQCVPKTGLGAGRLHGFVPPLVHSSVCHAPWLVPFYHVCSCCCAVHYCQFSFSFSHSGPCCPVWGDFIFAVVRYLVSLLPAYLYRTLFLGWCYFPPL